MDTTEVLQQCQAYLDGQLDPDTASSIDDHLKQDPSAREVFESERGFHAFLRRACADETPSDGFADRLRARLEEEMEKPLPAPRDELNGAVAPTTGLDMRPTHSIENAGRVLWLKPAAWAAGLLIAVSAAFVSYVGLSCPYLEACAGAFERMQARADLTTEDPVQLTRYVNSKTHAKLVSLPALDAYDLRPVSAGSQTFGKLAGHDVPNGVFVNYAGDKVDPVSLLVHPWEIEKLHFINYDSDKDIYCTEHGGVRMVCWRTADGNLWCTALSKRRSMNQIIEIAAVARQAIDQ